MDFLKNTSLITKESPFSYQAIRFISGVVTTCHKTPIKNAIVSFSSIGKTPFNTSCTLLGYIKTDDSGFFSFYIDLNETFEDSFRLSIYNPLTRKISNKIYKI